MLGSQIDPSFLHTYAKTHPNVTSTSTVIHNNYGKQICPPKLAYMPYIPNILCACIETECALNVLSVQSGTEHSHTHKDHRW